jgi:hypothetical protein
MYNGITLCFLCHKIADGFNTDGIRGEKVRRDLLFLTLRAFMKNTWWEMYLPQDEVENNTHFLKSVEKDVLHIGKHLL